MLLHLINKLGFCSAIVESDNWGVPSEYIRCIINSFIFIKIFAPIYLIHTCYSKWFEEGAFHNEVLL